MARPDGSRTQPAWSSRSRYPPEIASAEPAHPPVRVAGVRVEVVGDLAHVPVDRPVPSAQHLVGDPPEMPEHARELFFRRVDGVAAPDDHGDTTYLAFGDPSQLVVVVPGGETRRLAEL